MTETSVGVGWKAILKSYVGVEAICNALRGRGILGLVAPEMCLDEWLAEEFFDIEGGRQANENAERWSVRHDNKTSRSCIEGREHQSSL